MSIGIRGWERRSHFVHERFRDNLGTLCRLGALKWVVGEDKCSPPGPLPVFGIRCLKEFNVTLALIKAWQTNNVYCNEVRCTWGAQNLCLIWQHHVINPIHIGIGGWGLVLAVGSIGTVSMTSDVKIPFKFKISTFKNFKLGHYSIKLREDIQQYWIAISISGIAGYHIRTKASFTSISHKCLMFRHCGEDDGNNCQT